MLFEVIVDRWEYRPRRCSMSTYFRGQKGYLPEKAVREAASLGYVKILEEPDGPI